jgi:hypothetical protein
MNIAFPIVMSVSALLSGFWGWRLAFRSVYRRSFLSRSDRERRGRRLITGRNIRRLVVVAAFALAGAIVGFFVLFAVVHRR